MQRQCQFFLETLGIAKTTQEVLQLPRIMNATKGRSKRKFARHQYWECEFWFFEHLQCEKLQKLKMSSPAQEWAMTISWNFQARNKRVNGVWVSDAFSFHFLRFSFLSFSYKRCSKSEDFERQYSLEQDFTCGYFKHRDNEKHSLLEPKRSNDTFIGKRSSQLSFVTELIII